MMIARQGIGNAAFVHYDERNAVRLRPFFIWSCGKKVRARRNRSLVDETISTSGCSLSRSRSRMNFCRAPVCLKASPTSVKIHSVVRTWRLPIDCNSSGMPSITSAPVSDEMNRVPEDLHRRGGPMKIMIVLLRVIRWQTLHGPGYLQQRFAPRSPAGANLFFQQLVQFLIYLGELIPFQLRQLS